MRLIDADELKVSLKGLLHNTWQYAGSCAVIDEAPTVDAIQVVKCYECKHSYIYRSSVRTCGNSHSKCFMRSIDRDDFCKYGERMSDE